MPYMVAPGNHERDWPESGDIFGGQDSGGECGIVYESRFPMPYPGGGQPSLCVRPLVGDRRVENFVWVVSCETLGQQ